MTNKHLFVWLSCFLIASCSAVEKLDRKGATILKAESTQEDNAEAKPSENIEAPSEAPKNAPTPNEPYRMSYGFKSGRQLLNSYKSATGWKPSTSALTLFNAMEESLPIKGNASEFDSTKQGNIIKLASSFCTEFINDSAARKTFFKTDYATLRPNQITAESKSAIAKALMEGLWSYETKAMNMAEMEKLLVDLQTQILTGNVTVTQAMAGVCIAVASSMPAVML